MASWNTEDKNGMWKGGRSIASNGYVLIRVGTEHHLADKRGYAYEHRLVAEEKLGRRLQNHEIVHHINGNKADNRPGNLEVVNGNGEHSYLHRGRNSGLRKPGEANPIINCACGCGRQFRKYDRAGRSRRYISGHNPQSSPTRDLVVAALADGPKPISYLMSLHDNPRAIKIACSKLLRAGVICRIERGIYGL